MTPVASWALFLVCVGIGAVVYIAIAGARRYRGIETEWHRIRWERRNGGGIVYFPPEASWQEVQSFRDVFDSHVRVRGGVYDHEARGDFDR
jgi:hypothetical protein